MQDTSFAKKETSIGYKSGEHPGHMLSQSNTLLLESLLERKEEYSLSEMIHFRVNCEISTFN